jgi:ABC-type phosphate/phosphonate transport system substrate-binding protein
MALVFSCVSLCAGAPGGSSGETAFLPAKTSAADAGQKPMVLKIAVNDIYCRKTACSCIAKIATRSYDSILAELKGRHNITLEFTYFMEVFDLQKALLANRYDGVLCKPWTALRLSKRMHADLKRVADIPDPSGQALMGGMFLTSAKSPIRSLDDMQGKRIAIGQEDSYEKYQAPLRMLAAKNIRPAERLSFNSCGENISALMDGKVDVAVVSSYALTASCAVDFAKAEDFKTIATTEKMPLTSLILDMKKISESDAARLQAALLDVSGDKVPKDFTGKGFVLPASWVPEPLTDQK